MDGVSMQRLLDRITLVEGCPVVDLSGSPGGAGDWVSLEKWRRCVVVLAASVGTTGQEPTITLQQAKTAAGGTPKALNPTAGFVHKTASTDLSSTPTWTVVAPSGSNTFTVASSAAKDKLWAIEVQDSDLDVANGYYFLQASVADVGANAQLGYLLYILGDARYPSAPGSEVTAIS